MARPVPPNEDAAAEPMAAKVTEPVPDASNDEVAAEPVLVALLGCWGCVADRIPSPKRAMPGNGARGGKPLARCWVFRLLPSIAPAPSSTNTAIVVRC